MKSKSKKSEKVCTDAVNFLLRCGTSPLMERGRAIKVGRIVRNELGIITDYKRFSKTEGYVTRTYKDLS